jgi:Transposase DDE domain
MLNTTEMDSPVILSFYTQLISLLPSFCQTVEKSKAEHFTRSRKLPLPRLIVTLLHLAAGGSRHDGVDIKLGDFFNLSRRGGLWPEAQTPHRSALTKARSKLRWETFAELLRKAVDLAYQVFPQRDEYTWCGLSVFAFDGSKYILPATSELRKTFDPDSGLGKPGKGHYPQALTNTVYDVFRRMPIGRTACPIQDGDERGQALTLLELLPLACICLFDRGYPGYAFILALMQQSRYFLMRCPAQSTFLAVESFVRSGQKDGFIWLMPSDTFKRGLTKAERKTLKPIKLRIIRLTHPDGTLSVLLTNLFDKPAFPCQSVVDLYYRRWAVENHYRDEKVSFEIERFHSKTVNGVQQELFAILIVCVIARVVTALSVSSEAVETDHCSKAPQLKNAVKSFAREAALLVAMNSEQAFIIFQELLDDIRSVKYYQPKKPKPSKPRVNKGTVNKWQEGRCKKIAMAA